MNSLKIIPKLCGGSLKAPPSKSDSHRALIAAALADGDSVVSNLVYSQDILATLGAVEAFGKKFVKMDTQVIFSASEVSTPTIPVECYESGSTLRFMIPWSLLVSEPVTFSGKNHLAVRPLNDYIDLFNHFGIDYTYENQLPLTVKGKSISGAIRLSGNVSSQYYSGLFFVLPLMSENSVITVEGDLESKGYIDLTIDVLQKFGVTIENNNYKQFAISGNQKYHSMHYTVEGDYSNAAFWIVAGQISREIRIEGLHKQSFQRDSQIIELIIQMGGNIKWDGDVLISKPSRTHGIVIDASEIPDIIPVLCVLASLSEGTTRVINGQRLRIKESDRIKSTVSELTKLGATIIETSDGMIIEGKEILKGGRVDSWNDHRIAMATAIAAMRCEESVIIDNPMAVNKSYPHFFDDYKLLGGFIDE